MSTPPTLPPIPGRTVVQVVGTTVTYKDVADITHEVPLSSWLDGVPPFVSSFPYGNKVADENAECAYNDAMRYWRGVASLARPQWTTVSVTINGVTLDEAKVKALRYAVNTQRQAIMDDLDKLGLDYDGHTMIHQYLATLTAIQGLLKEVPPHGVLS